MYYLILKLVKIDQYLEKILIFYCGDSFDLTLVIHFPLNTLVHKIVHFDN